jgi:hypothetical protein
MIECRDLALNHRLVMGLQRHGAHTSVISLLGIAHIGVRDHYLSTKICYKQTKRFLSKRKRIQPYLPEILEKQFKTTRRGRCWKKVV